MEHRGFYFSDKYRVLLPDSISAVTLAPAFWYKSRFPNMISEYVLNFSRTIACVGLHKTNHSISSKFKMFTHLLNI